MSYNASETMQGCRSAYQKFMRRHPSILQAVIALKDKPEIQPRNVPDRVVEKINRFSEEIKEIVLAELRDGKTNAYCSQKHNINPATISKWRAKAGLPSLHKWGTAMSKEERNRRANERYAKRKLLLKSP